MIEWIKNWQNMLIFLGAPGVGKTHFCAALFPLLHGKTHDYMYWNERDYLSKIRKGMESTGGDYLGTVKYLMDHDFVIIDDIGSSGFNEWRTEVIFDTIDQRYESKKPTVFTSNLNRQQLTEGLGHRGVSRLFAKENLIIEFHDCADKRQEGK